MMSTNNIFSPANGAPIISPPVRVSTRFPARDCNSAHPLYARFTSGT